MVVRDRHGNPLLETDDPREVVDELDRRREAGEDVTLDGVADTSEATDVSDEDAERRVRERAKRAVPKKRPAKKRRG
jgi:Ran GTPase-activating protein (RanGAP) involved in mRNA processing and transport